MIPNCPPVILASSSLYRKQQLQKFGMTFTCLSPNIDESRKPSETPDELVKRLSFEKAIAIHAQYPDSVVIGSDQVAYIKEEEYSSSLAEIDILTKPYTCDKANQQLRQCAGKSVRFITGLCCLAPSHQQQLISEVVDVSFRKLSDEEIAHYIAVEQPLDCAGSFKVEGLGITLFDKVESTDPNTLVGLPLIALNKMLINIGINPLGTQT